MPVLLLFYRQVTHVSLDHLCISNTCPCFSYSDIVLDEENQECMPQESNDEDELDDVDSISQTSTIASAASTGKNGLYISY